MPDDLQAFQRVLKNFRSLALTIIGLATLPQLAQLGSWQPPKPHALATITSAVVVASLLLVYQSVATRKVNAARRWFKLAIIACGVAGVLYLVLEATFTFEIPTTKERIYTGFACTANARLVYPDTCPFLDEDALAEAGYVSSRLWTPPSLSLIQAMSVTAWLLMFAFFAAAMGIFLALNELKAEKRRRLVLSNVADRSRLKKLDG